MAASKQAVDEIAAQDEASKPQVRAPKPYGRPLAEILADLSKPIADKHLGHKEVANRKTGSKTTLTYISWHYAIKYLDYYAPGWSYEIRSVTQISGAVILTVRITIPCAEGLVYREATGIEEEETSSFGDTASNAESMALRRAAAKFGLGLYLYDKGNGASESGNGMADPRPKTLGDLITPKQLWMIRNLGREIGCDVEAECQGLMNASLEEISKRAASSFIDHLKRLGEEGATGAEDES